MPRFVVLKFGGTSVSHPDRWNTIEAVVRARLAEGLRPVVVCSALSGVSNALDGLADTAASGQGEEALQALITRHRSFSAAIGVEAPEEELEALSRLITAVGLLGEAPETVRARILARGELLSTRIGVSRLRSRGVDAHWLDARELLGATHGRVLDAVCAHDPDPALQARLGSLSSQVLLTQGFIARDTGGRTVLLGRGGSDTSAAYLAAKLGAVRCEIWTDVPGMFTADPRLVPSARLLRRLGWDEAQEIATTGAGVLHPRCLRPLQLSAIPLQIHSTPHPEVEGTSIGTTEDAGVGVKAISARRGLVLVSMETLGMWQQVGFLADAFSAFKRLGLSVDLVSTSETNVTVSLDPAANDLDGEVLDALIAELAPVCSATVIEGCASVSLVGRGIRAILHRLAPTLELFEEHRVHLLSQASSDLNLTVVVDDDQAERLVKRLHGRLFAGLTSGVTFGSSWQTLFERDEPVETAPAWWQSERDTLLRVTSTPCWAYHGPTVDEAAENVAALTSIDRVLYAVKANPNPEILRRIAAAGLGFECVSPGELELVRETVGELGPDRLLFTPNFAPKAEYQAAIQAGVRLTLDNLHPLKRWPELFDGVEIFARLDPGVGRGHHAHVKTAGASSKFGVAPQEIESFADLAQAAGAKVVGLHAHAGSGVLAPESWVHTAEYLAEQAQRFPDVRVLDLGGGLGVPERPEQRPLDLAALDASLKPFRAAHPDLQLWLEPGRYLVAAAGVLLVRVTQLKSKGAMSYVGVDGGMNHLIRPALYGAHHEIVNLSRHDVPMDLLADVVGPICETGDVLGRARRLPGTTAEGDVLAITNAGAYGRAMSSAYNSRAPAREWILSGP